MRLHRSGNDRSPLAAFPRSPRRIFAPLPRVDNAIRRLGPRNREKSTVHRVRRCFAAVHARASHRQCFRIVVFDGLVLAQARVGREEDLPFSPPPRGTSTTTDYRGLGRVYFFPEMKACRIPPPNERGSRHRRADSGHRSASLRTLRDCAPPCKRVLRRYAQMQNKAVDCPPHPLLQLVHAITSS